MEDRRRVRKTDLARNTRKIIQDIQRGQAALIEDRGRVIAVILHIADYHILRAATKYYGHPAEIDPRAGLSDDRLANLEGSQDVYDLVIGHYLADVISLGRAAELLNLPWLDLRNRFIRLDVPTKLGAEDENEALSESRASRQF